MSRDTEADPRDPELERLLAQAQRPVASAAFRADLQRRFTAADGPAVAAPARRLAEAPPRTRSFPFVWPFVLAASIAAIVFFVLSRDADPRWRVIDTGVGGEFIVDGIRIHSDDAVRLADALQTAREVETFDGRLRLQLRQDLVLDLDPKTRVSQLSFPPAGSYSIYANTGSVRVATGPGFESHRLRVMTDNMEMAVVGTIFGVDVGPMGTCLCCVDGTVRSDPRDGAGMQPTAAGEMCFSFSSGRKPLRGPIHAEHEAPLIELRDWSAAQWKR
ncbi:MAG: FecR domain-containing protein [Planctomycetes bacterium]|nr:FecR domain-containing protein [Planctomycetota bacterium]